MARLRKALRLRKKFWEVKMGSGLRDVGWPGRLARDPASHKRLRRTVIIHEHRLIMEAYDVHLHLLPAPWTFARSPFGIVLIAFMRTFFNWIRCLLTIIAPLVLTKHDDRHKHYIQQHSTTDIHLYWLIPQHSSSEHYFEIVSSLVYLPTVSYNTSSTFPMLIDVFGFHTMISAKSATILTYFLSK